MEVYAVGFYDASGTFFYRWQEGFDGQRYNYELANWPAGPRVARVRMGDKRREYVVSPSSQH